MIEVILHIFILVPLFNQLKHLKGHTSLTKLSYAMLLLSVVSFIQIRSFLSQGKLPHCA